MEKKSKHEMPTDNKKQTKTGNSKKNTNNKSNMNSKNNSSTKNVKNNKNSKNTKGKKSGILKKILIVIFILGIICCSIGLFLLYGPWSGFRDWLITTAMSSMRHQYLATWFYSDATIKECLDNNKVIEVSGVTDENIVEIVDYEEKETITYANEYERQILERSDDNNDYKIIKIDGGKDYSGYMAVIYDPSRVEVATSQYIGSTGQYLTTISKNTGALVAINAGGFLDENYQGSGASPIGITMSKGKIISNNRYYGSMGVIGFNQENKLILGKFSSTDLRNKMIRDASTFGPYLILNGEKSQVKGNGGWGKAPRTAIGQRADGIVLFLVLDGNRALGKGATIKDLIDIFDRYGAVNASNLDGGTSTSMTVKGKTVNNPTNLSGGNGTRPIPSAFILKADDSDDGDYSAVKDKVEN